MCAGLFENDVKHVRLKKNTEQTFCGWRMREYVHNKLYVLVPFDIIKTSVFASAILKVLI